MLHASEKVSGGILWANMHLLFWLSLVPFSTAWMGENHFSEHTVALYGFNLLMAGTAYTLLAKLLVVHHGENSTLYQAFQHDYKGKASMVVYAIAIPLALWQPYAACALYGIVAFIWFIPDRRVEKAMHVQGKGKDL